MRPTRLRWPEWVIAVGAIVLLASLLLLPWYAGSVDGWHGLHHARWLVVAAVALALLAAGFQAGRRGPAVPLTLTLFTGVLGGLCTLWLIYRVLISPPGDDRLVGGFVGLLGAVAITYGSWRSLRLDGIAPEDGPGEIPLVDLGAVPANPAPGRPS